MINDDYRLWNRRLTEHFFGESSAYRPVYLDVDEDRLALLAEGLPDPVDNFLAAMRASVLSQESVSFDTHIAELRAWKSRGDAVPPPFVGLLGLFVFAANRMRSEEEFRSSNYYRRLAELIETDAQRQIALDKRLPALGQEMSRFWDELNTWLEQQGGRHGIPTAYPYGGNVHVSRHISQALIRESDHAALQGLFFDVGLDPSDMVSPADMRKHLEEAGLAGHLSTALAALLREDGGAAEAINEGALDLLADWNGDDPRGASSGEREFRSPWRLLIRPLRIAAQPPRYEATFVAKDNSGRREGPAHLHIDGATVATDIQPSGPGWIRAGHRLGLADIPSVCAFSFLVGTSDSWESPDTLVLREDLSELYGFVDIDLPPVFIPLGELAFRP